MTAPAVAAQLATQWQLSPARVGDLRFGGAGRHEPGDAAGLPLAETRRLAPPRRCSPACCSSPPTWPRHWPAATSLLLALRLQRLAGGSLMILCLSSAASTATPSRAYGLWVMGQLVGAVGLGTAAGAVRTLRPGRLLPVAGRPDGPRLPLSRASPVAARQRKPAPVPARFTATAGRAASSPCSPSISASAASDLHRRHRRRRGIGAPAAARYSAVATLMGIAGRPAPLHRQPPAARPDAARRLPGDGRGDPPADRPATAGAFAPAALLFKFT